MFKVQEFGNDTVENLELSGASKDVIEISNIVNVIEEQVGMVAALPQLHHQVHDCLCSDFV